MNSLKTATVICIACEVLTLMLSLYLSWDIELVFALILSEIVLFIITIVIITMRIKKRGWRI